MRLWHTDIIKYLPSKLDYKGCTNQLGGQWTEIRMILGTISKHNKVNHSTVNYVNNHHLSCLYAYALVVADEMIKRGFNLNQNILDTYTNDPVAVEKYNNYMDIGTSIYPEHNNEYLEECLQNLERKGINLRERVME